MSYSSNWLWYLVTKRTKFYTYDIHTVYILKILYTYDTHKVYIYNTNYNYGNKNARNINIYKYLYKLLTPQYMYRKVGNFPKDTTIIIIKLLAKVNDAQKIYLSNDKKSNLEEVQFTRP